MTTGRWIESAPDTIGAAGHIGVTPIRRHAPWTGMVGAPAMESVFESSPDADFYELAPFYDFVYRRDFDYGSQATRVRSTQTGESVLELACGTGLLAERLVEGGTYVGVDASREMLEVARRRVDAPFVEADARRLCFDRTFGAVAMLGLSASHFGVDDLADVTAVALDQLEDGPFLLDAHDRARVEDGYTTEDRYESDRWTVVYRGTSSTTGGGWCRHSYEYEVTDRETGRCRTFDGTYEMRFWAADELRALLADSGFGAVSVEVEDGVVRAVASPP